MQGGEQYRSLLADLLWGRAQDIINARGEEEMGGLTEDQKANLNTYFHDGIKTPEDVIIRAKGILQRACESGAASQIKEYREEIFIRAVFSYHPNHERDMTGVLRVGTCMGHHSFFMTSRAAVREGDKLTENDAVSLKKCMAEISQAYTLGLRDYAEKKY